MKKKKKLSGFTLVELIIVVAIFSGIAVGALAMIRPAMQIFNRTSSQEGAGANIDNITRYLQDNLRYADRVNVYQGYGETSPGGMLTHEIDSLLPSVELNNTTNEYEKVYAKASPLEFFREYYYSSPSDYENKKINVMQIDDKGKISIYTFSLKTGNEDTTKRTSISDAFYEDYMFNIPADGWKFYSDHLTIEMKITYKGATRNDSGSLTEINQTSSVNVNFPNIKMRSELDVIEMATLPTDKTFTKDESTEDVFTQKKNTVVSRPASAYRQKTGTEGGYTYIIYTVPEIITTKSGS
ncbi:MAG: type II secretion system GspH family protein [Clostridium sp.]|nr:type II secretion system GspH family protein [Clostridium sp.]MCM1547085.1 type II secretion system GspH family protein [Ruminococcus sp.]